MAYVSGLLQSLTASVHLQSALSRSDLQAAAAQAERASQPGRISPDELPSRFFWGYSDEKVPKRLPDMMMASFIFVTEPMVELLKDSDLGDGFLWDVEIFEYDEVTPASVKVKGLHIGTFKSALFGDESTGLKKLRTNPPKWMLPASFKIDGPIVLFRGADEGADIWRDEASPTLLYFSQKLGDAILSAGLCKELRLLQCETEGFNKKPVGFFRRLLD